MPRKIHAIQRAVSSRQMGVDTHLEIRKDEYTQSWLIRVETVGSALCLFTALSKLEQEIWQMKLDVTREIEGL